MAAPGWPEVFLRVLEDRDKILNPGYLFSVFRNGQKYCKACGGFYTESNVDHMAFHETELDIVLEDRRIAAAAKRSDALRAARAAKHTTFTGDNDELSL